MKLPTKDIDNFISNLPVTVKALLVYGPDQGLVEARAKKIKKNFHLAASFNYEQIKNNPSLCKDALNSLDLFGQDNHKNKLITIECAGASISEPISNLIQKGSFNGLILFIAGDLGTDSNLRKLFEKNIDFIFPIPCYVEDQHMIAKIIFSYFKENSITSEPGLVEELSKYIPRGNHALILKEIEKICLFLGDKKQLNRIDIIGFLDEQDEVSFDKFCYSVSLKKANNVKPLLIKLQNEGHNLVSIIRFLSKHIYRLYQVKSLIVNGQNEYNAINTLQPPVFFKQTNDFSQSLKLWGIKELIAFLDKLTKLELVAKQSPHLAQLEVERAIINIIT